MCVCVSQEEDEMERLSQAQDHQDDEGGDNTEPLDDMSLGQSHEKVPGHLVTPP